MGAPEEPDWEWKRQWYLDNGYVEGETLFTTRDDDQGGLDSQQVDAIVSLIEGRI